MLRLRHLSLTHPPCLIPRGCTLSATVGSLTNGAQLHTVACIATTSSSSSRPATTSSRATTPTPTRTVRRGVFPTLPSHAPPMVSAASANVTNDSSDRLLLLHRLSQLENQGTVYANRQPHEHVPGLREYAALVIDVIQRLLALQRRSVGLGTAASQSTPSSGAPKPPLAEPFTFHSGVYVQMLGLLRLLPVWHLPIVIVDLVWAHMTAQETIPQGWTQLTSQKFFPFKPTVRVINIVIDLYSSLITHKDEQMAQQANDRVWTVWQYLRRQSDLEPSIITINTMHTAILRNISRLSPTFSQTAGEEDRNKFEEVWRVWEGISSKDAPNSIPPEGEAIPELFKPLLNISPFGHVPGLLARAIASPVRFTDASVTDAGFSRNVLSYFRFCSEPLKALHWVDRLRRRDAGSFAGVFAGLGDVDTTGPEMVPFRLCLHALERAVRQNQQKATPSVTEKANGKNDEQSNDISTSTAATTKVKLSNFVLKELDTMLWTYFTQTLRLHADASLLMQRIRILQVLRKTEEVVQTASEALRKLVAAAKNTPGMKLTDDSMKILVTVFVEALTQVKSERLEALAGLPKAGSEEMKQLKQHAGTVANGLTQQGYFITPELLRTDPEGSKISQLLLHCLLVPLAAHPKVMESLNTRFVLQLAQAWMDGWENEEWMEGQKQQQREKESMMDGENGLDQPPVVVYNTPAVPVVPAVAPTLAAAAASDAASTPTPSSSISRQQPFLLISNSAALAVASTSASNPKAQQFTWTGHGLDAHRLWMESVNFTVVKGEDPTVSLEKLRKVYDSFLSQYTRIVSRTQSRDWNLLREDPVLGGVRKSVGASTVINAYLQALSNLPTLQANEMVDNIFREWFIPVPAAPVATPPTTESPPPPPTPAASRKLKHGKLICSSTTLVHVLVSYLRARRSIADMLAVRKGARILWQLDLDASGYNQIILALAQDLYNAKHNHSTQQQEESMHLALRFYREATDRDIAPTVQCYNTIFEMLSVLPPEVKLRFYNQENLSPSDVSIAILKEMNVLTSIVKTPYVSSLLDLKNMPEQFRVRVHHLLMVLETMEKEVEHLAAASSSCSSKQQVLQSLLTNLIDTIFPLFPNASEIRHDLRTIPTVQQVRKVFRMGVNIMWKASSCMLRSQEKTTVVDANTTVNPSPSATITDTEMVIPPIQRLSSTNLHSPVAILPAIFSLYTWASSFYPTEMLSEGDWFVCMRVANGLVRRAGQASDDGKEQCLKLFEYFVHETTKDDASVSSFSSGTSPSSSSSSSTVVRTQGKLTGDHYAHLIFFHTFISASASASTSTPTTRSSPKWFEHVWELFTRSQVQGVHATPLLIHSIFLALAQQKQWTTLLQLYQNMLSMSEVREQIPEQVHVQLGQWMKEFGPAGEKPSWTGHEQHSPELTARVIQAASAHIPSTEHIPRFVDVESLKDVISKLLSGVSINLRTYDASIRTQEEEDTFADSIGSISLRRMVNKHIESALGSVLESGGLIRIGDPATTTDLLDQTKQFLQSRPSLNHTVIERNTAALAKMFSSAPEETRPKSGIFIKVENTEST